MPVSMSYEEFLHERLAELGRYTFKRMFGGLGIYTGEVIFAIAYNDQLFFRVSSEDVARFEALGMGPFDPMPDKWPIRSYYQVPEEVLNDHSEFPLWIKRAVLAAAAAKTAKSAKAVKASVAKRSDKAKSVSSISLKKSRSRVGRTS